MPPLPELKLFQCDNSEENEGIVFFIDTWKTMPCFFPRNLEKRHAIEILGISTIRTFYTSALSTLPHCIVIWSIYNQRLLRGTERVISSDPPGEDGNSWFTTVPLKPLSDQRPNLKNLAAAQIFLVLLKIVLNFSRFKPALNWNRFLTDLSRGSNSLNSDTVKLSFF